jgi:hypothetical protein
MSLITALAAAVIGQDQPPAKDQKKSPAKAADIANQLAEDVAGGVAATKVKDDRGPDGKPQQPRVDQSAEIMARIAKDMKSSVERLDQTDPGDVTRKIQGDIVDGLDELIKQNTKSQGGGGGGGGASKPKAAAGGGGGSGQAKNTDMAKAPSQDKMGAASKGKQGDDNDQPGKAKSGEGPDGKEKDKGQGDGKDDQAGSGKKADKDDKMGQTKPNEPGKDGPGGGGQGSAKDDKGKVKTNIAADLHRNDWGHLPLAIRQDMDAYSRERFMPRYDEALQQYYRSISEQGQRKD